MAISLEKTSYVYIFSDFLSIITISICFILKVPQILKLLQVKNARGINLVGLIMELTSFYIAHAVMYPILLGLIISSYTIMMSYNFRHGYAVLSYLEYPIILVQELILIFLVLKYNDMLNIYTFFGSGMYFFIAASLLFGIAPMGLLAFLVPLCTPIGASSKVVQLVEILKTGNAQSVSILTWFISAFTNFTRVFTITVESADLTLLLNFTINTLLSTSVMIAAMFYKNPTDMEATKKFN